MQPVPGETRVRPYSVSVGRWRVLGTLAVLLLVGTLGLFLWSQRPRLVQDDIRNVIHATIQRETPASFLVTGAIEITTITHVEVPEPSIYALEPNLEQLEVETQRGWARLSASTTEQVRDRAIELVQATMRAQGERHLQDSAQPRINTADALYEMLRPALVAAGMPDPQIRFRVSRVLVVEPGRR